MRALLRLDLATRVAAFSVAFATAGCNKPAPPQITPVRATLAAVTPAGVNLLVDLDAANPNRFELTAQSLTAKVTLDHQYTVADTTTAGKTVTIPPKDHASLLMPVQLLWADMPALAALAANPDGVPNEVDGAVTIGGESLHVSVPFHLEGTFTQTELANMLRRSMPAMPGARPGMRSGTPMQPGTRPGMP
jgi:LEA14-like dessication related protein